MADTADLKSVAVRHEGSNPSAPTKEDAMNAWEFVDTILAEAEADNAGVTFTAAQVSKLREMIAERDTLPSGRSKQRLKKGLGACESVSVRMPIRTYDKVATLASDLGMTVNAIINFICLRYLDITDNAVEDIRPNIKDLEGRL